VANETDGFVQTHHSVLREGLAKLGWIEGPQCPVDYRYSGDDSDRLRANADEVGTPAPDIIAVGAQRNPGIAAADPDHSIVFTNLCDPVICPAVEQHRASGRAMATGATNLFPSLAAKWLSLLKEAAAAHRRVRSLFT